jgi:hypothetical protein
VVFPEVPTPPELSGDSAAVLRAQHASRGLALDARTAMPSWLGEHLDVGYAIDVLHPRAAGDSSASREWFSGP